jgi:hypothetical protein
MKETFKIMLPAISQTSKNTMFLFKKNKNNVTQKMIQ